jgi:ribonucleoside-triphosphate reductase
MSGWQIKKRDGRIVDYDKGRIVNAVLKAMKAVGVGGEEDAEKVANSVERRLKQEWFDKDVVPSVEEIQDLVEITLIKKGFGEVAKAYILYREKRREAREIGRALVDGIVLVDDYLDEVDWRVKENANMGFSLQGLNFYVSSSVTAKYWLEKLYPKEVAHAHKDGDFHVHDLGILGAYCCGWDLYDLLLKGFGGVYGKVESRPPKHFRSALGQIVNFLFTIQGEVAGAVALSNFDTLLAPFVRYDKLGYEDVKQCIQEFLYNMNVPTRVGFQTPFSNLTFDLKPSKVFKGWGVVVGGKVQEDVYDDFQEEMNLINKAFCEVMLEGDARGRIFTFPIPTYNITRDFDWDNSQYESLWEMTRKYGIPYFANFVNSDMNPEDARSMCCRLRLDKRELRRRGGGLFGADALTGSIGVVTINLPRVGYLSASEEEFFERLERLMELAKVSLEIKRKVVEDFTEKGLYPYCKYWLGSVKERSGRYWENHFSTIGLVGMNEMCENFLGVGIWHPEGKKFSINVLQFMRERLKRFQEETGNLYNLEATPAEGCSYRLALLDKKIYSEIFTSGTAHTPYYTNSCHLPVGWTDNVFEVLLHQDDLQILFTGGTVVHLYIGEEIGSTKVVKEFVRKVVENFRLPYFSITPVFSICPVHGYLPGVYWYCPYTHTEEELQKYGIEIEEV